MSDPCCPECGHALDARGRCPSRTCRTELMTLSDVPSRKANHVDAPAEHFRVKRAEPALLSTEGRPVRFP